MQYSKVHIMQKEKDPLNLGSLSAVAPPADGWPAIRAELQKQQRNRRWTRYSVSTLAVAAMVTLAVGLYIHQPATDTAAPPPALDSLIALSQQLETRIRVYRSEIGDLPMESLVYQVELEDLIAQVDEELSVNPDSAELWSRRVNLMLDLSGLYQNKLRRDFSRMASL
jgi:hypothetical protein